MNRLFLTLAITVMVSSVISSQPAAQPRPAGEQAERAQIIDGPALESATERSAIIRWTTNTGGGTVTHYGVVQYGTDPKHLSQTAKSRNRWNKNLPYVIYRVRVDGLKPQTTYYYKATSMESNGVESPVTQFPTPGPGERIVAFPPQPARLR
jgi:phosphodiesterase/alkaline phosphatase D-like protein